MSGSRQAPDATRRELLAAGAAAVGAAAGGALLAAAPASASAAVHAHRHDGELLSHTLGMAQLGAYVYEAVFAERIIPGGRRRALDGFDRQERAHVAALAAAVRARGGHVGAPPSSDADANRRLAHRQIPERLGHLQGPEDALGLLIEIERSSIGSCFVALGGLTGADAITLVARIMGNDAQHEAIVSLQRHALRLKAAAPYALVAGTH